MNMSWKKQMIMIITGCMLVALGIRIFAASHIVLGGTAGMGLILHRVTGLSIGMLFFVINIPFYFLSVRQLGVHFTLKTFLSVTLLSITTDLMDSFLKIEVPYTIIGAVVGGALIGFGLTVLFRSNSSLGGINILALFLDRRYGIHPGKTILVSDICIVLSALAVFTIVEVAYSILAIFIMSTVLGRYHKKSPIEKNNKNLDEMEKEAASIEGETAQLQ
ncbi:putative 5xTM membrane YitT family protein [Aneurinibacillus soli]|uniref:Uncharacterized protein n=1 Tax=Aneurinibacillus soli TaxID=1500254 RepID=A0A0U5B377_9BACL|nr:YitT family protein [Aneurinibacillus soli]PYE57644.1 putative 5xTM membrane YitT family protein [Aneurinibacillus soli]BAU26118.1 hypothetical protein CB4_00220 [Aneurinibacillus soli]